jgi:hypothetical protein
VTSIWKVSIDYVQSALELASLWSQHRKKHASRWLTQSSAFNYML